MSDPIKIQIESVYSGKGAAEAAKSIAAVEKATIQAAKSQAQLAQAEAQGGAAAARLATAQNQVAISAQKLAQAETKTAGDIAKTEASMSRAAIAALRLQQAQEKAAKPAQSLGSALQGLQGALGAAGLALGAQQIIQGGVALADLGMKAELVEKRFNQLAAAAGNSGDALLAALRSASGGEISDLNLQLAANRANLLGVATSAEDLATLMAIARDRAQNLGTTATEAFDDLVTGLGRGSPLILDNLGIMVSVKEANEQYAASVGKTVQQLTEAEQKQALINAVVAQGKATLEQTGGAVETTASTYAKLGVAAENAGTKIGEFLAKAGQGTANALTGVLQAAGDGVAAFGQIGAQQQELNARLLDGADSYAAYQAGVTGVNQKITEQETVTTALAMRLPVLTEQQFALAQALTAQGASSQEAVAQVSQYGQALSQLTEPQREFVANLVEQGTSLKDAVAAAQPLQATLGVIDAAQQQLAGSGQMSADAASTLANRMAALAASGGPVEATIAAIADGLLMGSISADQATTAISQLEQAQQRNAMTTNGAATAAMQGAQATQQVTQAVNQEASALVDEIAKKQASQEQAQLLAAMQAQLAALGPQVAGGLISDAAAASQLAAHYGIAYGEALKLIQAQAALARATGEARLAGQKKNTVDLTGGRGPVADAPGRRGASDSEIDRIARQQAEAAKAAADAEAARARQIAQTGTPLQKAAQLQQNYNDAVAKYGPNSAQAIDAETALIASRQKGGAAASKRADAEAAAGDKIVDIAQKTADKLVEIDEKAAERRAEAQRNLANDMRSFAADMVKSSEANDLDLVGADESQVADLRAREEAEAKAKIAAIQAVEEARQTAASGDAELADDQLKIRQKQIADQQQLDEDYAKKRAELAGDPALTAALQKEYDEATAANQAAAQVEMDIAQQKSDQRKAQVEAEKQAVMDAAAAQVVAMGKTGEAAGAAQSRVSDLASAIANLPASKTVAINIVENKSGDSSGSGSSGSSVKAAGGGTFLATSDTTFHVGEGDNPEVVTVTPLVGGGSTSVSGSGVISMAGGGSAVVDDAAASAISALQNAPGAAIPAAAKVASSGGGGGSGGSSASTEDALKAAEDAIKLLESLADLRDRLADIGPPLDQELVGKLATEAMQAANLLRANASAVSKDEAEAFERWASTTKDAIGLLKDVASLRTDLVEAGSPIDEKTIARLASEAAQARRMIEQYLIPTGQAQANAIKRFIDVSGDSLQLLSDAASLRDDIGEIGPPINEASLNTLAYEAQQARRFAVQYLIPTAEAQTDIIQRYIDLSSDSISLLRDAAGLRKDLEEIGPPISEEALNHLGYEAQQARRFAIQYLMPTTEALADGMAHYVDSASSAISLLKDVADLRKTAAEAGPPLDEKMIAKLAAEGRRALNAVQGTLIPIGEEQGKAIQAYADAAGASIGLLKDAAGFTSDLFQDYSSPTDAQIAMVAKDADRVTRTIAKAAVTYDTKGLEAAKTYSDALGGTFSALTDGLKFVEALNTGDYKIDQTALAQFVSDSALLLDQTKAIAAQAGSIPAGDIAALSNVSAALTDYSESLLGLASVPSFQQLPSYVGGGGSQTNMGGIMFNIYAMDPNAIANTVIARLSGYVGLNR